MGKWIDIPGGTRGLRANSSAPDNANQPAPGVLALHAWWGVNAFFQSFCDRLAAENFTVLAPDLYHGKVAKTIAEAEALDGVLEMQQAETDIAAALRHLQGLPAVGGRPVGLVGFSLGAFLGTRFVASAGEAFRAVVLFYGMNDVPLNRTRAAFLIHFADNDPYVAAEEMQAIEENIRAAGLESQVYVYPGTGHWFFESDRPDAYQSGAAELAWSRTVDFLKDHLR